MGKNEPMIVDVSASCGIKTLPVYRNIWHRTLSGLNHIYLKQQHKWRTCLPGGYPVGAMIELCNVCNLRCALCPSGNGQLKRKTGFMKPDLFKRIVDELDDTYVRHLVPVMWGESLLHPQLVELLQYARRKTWHISMTTNGNKVGNDQYFKDFVGTGIDEVICAVDGHDQDAYESYRRGGKLQVVHDFLRKMRESRDAVGATRPILVAQIHLNKKNEDHLDVIKKSIEHYVDSFQTKRLRMFFTEMSDIKEKKGLHDGIKPVDPDKQFPSLGRSSCPTMLYSLNINWEGEVLACCRDPLNILRFGSLQEQSLRSILSSTKFKEGRQKLLRGEYWEDVCKTCALY